MDDYRGSPGGEPRDDPAQAGAFLHPVEDGNRARGPELQTVDRAAIEQHLDWMFGGALLPGEQVEIRSLDRPVKSRWSGDLVRVAAMAADLAADGRNTYFCSGVVADDFQPANPGGAVGDKDIVRRLGFLYDFDTVRPDTNTPASDEEAEATIRDGTLVGEFLSSECDWPEPLRLASGNGLQLHYQTAFPNDKKHGGLIRKAHLALPRVAKILLPGERGWKLDTAISNASRLMRLAGTANVKSSPTADRPNRLARLLSVPAEKTPLTLAHLRAVVALADELDSPLAGAQKAPRGGAERNAPSTNGSHRKPSPWAEGYEILPGDDFNQRGDWRRDVLDGFFTLVSEVGDEKRWLRVGKDDGISATTNHNGTGNLKVFTTSTPLSTEGTHTKFGAYAVLHHGGDFEAAAKALAEKGYGKKAERPKRGRKAAPKQKSDGKAETNGEAARPPAPPVADEGASVTEDGHPIVAAGSNGYYVDKGFFEHHDPEKGTQTLTNFTARITHDVVRHESATTQRQFRISARTLSGVSATADVPAVDYRGAKWVHDQLGSCFTVHEGRSVPGHTTVAIQLHSQADGIHRMDVHTSTGWIKVEDGRWVYLYAGGMIGGAGLEGRYEVDLPKNLAAYSLPDPPRGRDRVQQCIRACLNLWNFADPARPSSGAMAAVLLCLPWRAVLGPSNFVVHFSGTTGTRKTTVARLVLQHFSKAVRGRECELTASWKATVNSLQRYAHDVRDSVLPIDELTGYAANETAKEFVQAQGNLKGRERMTRDGKHAPSLDPRGSVLSTGESDPTRQSAQGRMLTIEFFPGTVDLETLTRCQKDADAGLYGEAMSAYLAWLADGRLEHARAEHVGWMEMATEHIASRVADLGVHPRQPSIAGHLVAGLMRFLQFAREIGAIDEGESDFYRDSATEAFVDLMSELAIDQIEASDGHKFIRLIGSALNSGKWHLLDSRSNLCPFGYAVASGWRQVLKYTGTEDGGKGQDYYWDIPTTSEHIGYIDQAEGYVYLDPDLSKKAASEAGKRAGCPIENISKIGRELAKDKLCEEFKEGGKTRYDIKRQFHKSGKKRYFKLKIENLFGISSAEEDARNSDPVPTVPTADNGMGTAF